MKTNLTFVAALCGLTTAGGFDAGVDLGSTVSRDYFGRRPFKFEGKINKVNGNSSKRHEKLTYDNKTPPHRCAPGSAGLSWTTSGPGPRFGLLVHPTDAEREHAYDRTSHIGKLSKGLDKSAAKSLAVMDMKAD